MHSTSKAFAGIRDEIVGIKNVCKIRSQAVESEVENITESTVALKKELSNVSTTLKSRLQSITDHIGSSQLKKDNENKTSRSNSETMSNKTSTSTNNVNESVHVDSLHAEKSMPNKSSHHNRSKRTKGRVLLIGSSILQRVNKRGLSGNVDVSTNPGARVLTIKRKLEIMDLSPYSSIVIQAGGNDLASGRNEEAVENDFCKVINYIKSKLSKTKIYISEITPRLDADVTDMNSYINFLCLDNDIYCIPVSQRLKLKTFLFWKDQVHLSDKGTAVLLKTYNEHISILKQDSPQRKFFSVCCFGYGQEGH